MAAAPRRHRPPAGRPAAALQPRKQALRARVRRTDTLHGIHGYSRHNMTRPAPRLPRAHAERRRAGAPTHSACIWQPCPTPGSARTAASCDHARGGVAARAVRAGRAPGARRGRERACMWCPRLPSFLYTATWRRQSKLVSLRCSTTSSRAGRACSCRAASAVNASMAARLSPPASAAAAALPSGRPRAASTVLTGAGAPGAPSEIVWPCEMEDSLCRRLEAAPAARRHRPPGRRRPARLPPLQAPLPLDARCFGRHGAAPCASGPASAVHTGGPRRTSVAAACSGRRLLRRRGRRGRLRLCGRRRRGSARSVVRPCRSRVRLRRPARGGLAGRRLRGVGRRRRVAALSQWQPLFRLGWLRLARSSASRTHVFKCASRTSACRRTTPARPARHPRPPASARPSDARGA